MRTKESYKWCAKKGLKMQKMCLLFFNQTCLHFSFLPDIFMRGKGTSNAMSSTAMSFWIEDKIDNMF